jgi:predicted molibdopterin-dependent oxidoreductase YjgC
VHSEARLTAPAIRKNGSLENAGWDEALGFAAQKLKEIVSSDGEQSVAGLASARCSNEALFAFQRLMREGLGTSRIDTPAHMSNLAVIEAMTEAYGVPASTANLSDVDAADVILVVDSNIVNTHPVAALEALRVYHSGSAKVLVVGHRSNKLTTQCTHFARTKPGTEVALLNGLAHIIIEGGGSGESGPDGYDGLKTHVAKYQLSAVSDQLGIDSSIISDMADAIASAKNFLLIISPGSLHSSVNSSITRAAVNLAVLKEGKVLALMHEGNAQGALDMGVSPDFLPGYKEAEGAQGGSLEAMEILRGVEAGDIKGLYLMGGDIRKEMALLGIPLDALSGLDLLVVQDVFASPVTELAHVVLPACSFAEREASYTNSYRTVQNSPRAIEPLGDCRADTEILSGLGQKIGLAKTDSLQAVRSQIVSAAPIYEVMKGTMQQAGASEWDYATAAPDAKRKLSNVTENQGAPDSSHPYMLTFDNMLHFGGLTSLHAAALGNIRVDGVVEISADDAATLDIQDGASVKLDIKDGGSAILPVRISRELPSGVISVPAHSFEIMEKLISKLDPTALKAESDAPVWFAGIKKD